jgi:outer membrane lipoprotein-sorting protein
MFEAHMNKLFIGFALAALLTPAALAQTKPPAAQDIVAAADKTRNPGQPFRITNTLVEYIGGQPRDRVTLVVFAKEDKQTHQFSNLVRYVDPPRDTGKMVLMNGSNMWFYDPSSKVSVRISPQQRLMGQASDGDVVTANLAKDYTAKLLGEETLQDADRKDRACWHLDLAAASPEAIYSRIEYWVEKGTYRPVKGKFYSDSGRLLKIAYYHKYVEQLGGMRASETIIIDSVDQNLVTTMTDSDMRAQDIPDAWFQREYLPRLKVD